MITRYRDLLAVSAFRWFWSGFTLSSLGDGMTQVALTWFVFESTGSVSTLALFTFVYTAPVILGGFLAGSLLDRFDRRTVMLLDSLVRGAAVGLIPVLYATGLLEFWHVFAVAALHGLLKMIVLAGAPSVVPSIVPSDRLDTANAMEMLGYTITGVVGPAAAGLLIPMIGAPNVLALDAASYAIFAVALTRIPALPPTGSTASPARSRTFVDAVRLLMKTPVLLSTTLMFMTFNVGQGLLLVWLPVLVSDTLKGGPQLYGLLLGALSAGEIVGSLLAGGGAIRRPLGSLIGAAQALSGVAIALIVLRLESGIVATALFAFGLTSAPLTIWAQTLRMRVIPGDLRGRSFALLRTLMQGTLPVGGGLAGLVLPAFGIPVAIAVSAGLIGIPGLLGLATRPLRIAGHPRELDRDAAKPGSTAADPASAS